MDEKRGDGPWRLSFHEKNGFRPFDLTARVLGLVNHEMKYAWDKPQPKLLQTEWEEFLELRAELTAQLSSVAGRVSQYGMDPFLNLRCELVSMAESVVDYLRYLPRVLIPAGAQVYLPLEEVVACQAEFAVLETRVQAYLETHAEAATA